MLCPCCKKTMVEREGRFGTFFFCPGQKTCGQKTLSLSLAIPWPVPSSQSSRDMMDMIDRATLDPPWSLANQDPVATDSETDDPMYGTGDDYRPY